MIDHAEGPRNQLSDLLETSFELKQPLAFQAVKVMMMGLTADFIARRMSGKLDRNEPSFVHQAFESSIDRCDPESAEVLLRQFQHFFGA